MQFSSKPKRHIKSRKQRCEYKTEWSLQFKQMKKQKENMKLRSADSIA